MATIIPLGVQKRRYLSGQGKELWTPLFFLTEKIQHIILIGGCQKLTSFLGIHFFINVRGGQKMRLRLLRTLPLKDLLNAKQTSIHSNGEGYFYCEGSNIALGINCFVKFHFIFQSHF